ncbi:Complex 1 LYR protein [Plasmopara halstedii]|uniref:Complex 1 LYR protein n=1 Tax=Plasmopara halstedii TaxID=4781 RepID=A0A0P1AWJ5_PLAHL|nr:Complex 1 LYR protein [Plasmopara halstedii]CEG45822.1 Complex 1 LYR protein [Plasmopara halstedii]|eukprot:XP_024582191.1 Complex 1 LYR protein [Plasmopara halstedii]
MCNDSGEGGYDEQAWIRAEARRRFEENRSLAPASAIEEAVRQGHNQVDVALHYKICYPRPQYVDPCTLGGESNFQRQSSRANTKLGRLHKSKVQRQFQPRGRS